MQSIKHLKNDYLQLGNLIYKPYKVCSLPANFGCIEFNEKKVLVNGLTTKDILISLIK